MPSSNQNMFETEFPNYTSSHSKSSASRLSAAYPDSPVHSGVATTIGLERGIPELDREKVKQWYEENVLAGGFPPNSDFSEGDYDYSESPSIPGSVEPERESAPGEDGSSIVATGKGPNVATMGTGTGIPDISSSPMVDPSEASSPAPFVESLNTDPKASSDSQGSATPLTSPGGLGVYGTRASGS